LDVSLDFGASSGAFSAVADGMAVAIDEFFKDTGCETHAEIIPTGTKYRNRETNIRLSCNLYWLSHFSRENFLLLRALSAYIKFSSNRSAK
jgi:hypothetical protein